MLDYWRNEEKTASLGLEPEDMKYYLYVGDITYCLVTKKDLENLRNSINLLLEDK